MSTGQASGALSRIRTPLQPEPGAGAGARAQAPVPGGPGVGTGGLRASGPGRAADAGSGACGFRPTSRCSVLGRNGAQKPPGSGGKLRASGKREMMGLGQPPSGDSGPDRAPLDRTAPPVGLKVARDLPE